MSRPLGDSSVMVEHPATDVVHHLYRLFKLSLVHDLNNTALTRAAEHAADIFRQSTLTAPEGVTVEFVGDTVLVDGQLLRSTRTAYENALELGRILASAGYNQVVYRPEVSREDIEAALGEYLRKSGRGQPPADMPPMNRRFELRFSAGAIHLEDESDIVVNKVMSQTFGYAVVVVNQLLSDVGRQRYLLSRHVKRICQRLVMLADTNQAAFTGLASMPHSLADAASRAVSASVLAVSTARLATRDLKVLSRVAMAAMLFEVGLPRAIQLEAKRQAEGLDDAVDPHTRIPTSAALVMASLGRLRDDALHRTVIAFESQWVNRELRLGTLYGGLVSARTESALVATIWRFVDLMSESEGQAFTRDQALLVMAAQAADERSGLLIQLLMSALGIYPIGTVVQLTSGWEGVVVRAPDHPAHFRRPQVYLVTDPQGALHEPVAIDLTDPRPNVRALGTVEHVVQRPGPMMLELKQRVLDHATRVWGSGMWPPAGK